MSYRSRVYRQRNLHTHDEKGKEPFFSKQNDINKQGSRNTFFQAKLSVNKPGDKYEQEADSVANEVVNKKTSTPVVQQKRISSIQRLATPLDDEKLGTNDARMERDKEIQEKPMQRMDADTEKEKEKEKGIQKMDDPMKEEEEKEKTSGVQAKQDAGANTAPANVSSSIENSSGKGNPLPQKTLSEMNSSFGADFSGVRVHNDSEAISMNRELQAQAFTHGRDIYFNEGRYNPANARGKTLLAHELTHVVQQQGLENNSIQRSCNDGACDSCSGGTKDFWITFYFRRKATRKTMNYLRQQINSAKTVLANCCLKLKAEFNWTLLGGGGTFNFLNSNPDGSWNYSADASALGSGQTFAGSRGIPVLVVDDVPASGGGVTVDTRFDAAYTGRTYAVVGVNQINPNPGCNHLAHELWHVSSGIVGHDAAHGTLAACTGNTVSPEYCNGLRNIVAPIGDFPEPARNTAVA